MLVDLEKYLAFLYVDSCDVYRNVITKKDGITSAERVLVAESVKCQLDTSEVVPSGSDAYQISANYTVYFAPDADIQKGDELLITTEYGDKFQLYAGAPRTYVGSHKELEASVKQYV